MRAASACAALTLFLLASIAPAQADDKLWLASGSPGGTYRDVYAINLGKLLRGYDVLYHNTSGSGENLDLLAAGEADLAFAQADIYAGRLQQDSDRYSNIMVLGKLADECVYVAHRKNGDVQTLAQLGGQVEGRAARIAAGPPGSGSSGTWSYLTQLDTGLAGASVQPDSGTLALNRLALGGFDAVIWVTDPQNFEHAMLRAVLTNKDLELMSLNDPALSNSLEDGTRVYERKSVPLTDKWNSKKIKTVCTSAVIFARRDAEPKLTKKVADLVSLNLSRIVAPTTP